MTKDPGNGEDSNSETARRRDQVIKKMALTPPKPRTKKSAPKAKK